MEPPLVRQSLQYKIDREHRDGDEMMVCAVYAIVLDVFFFVPRKPPAPKVVISPNAP